MPWSIENSVVSAELKRFIAEKCRQVRAERRAPGHLMGALSDSLFTAAEHCDWAAVSQSLQEMYRLMKDPENRSPSAGLVYPVEWAAINEIGAVLGRFAEGEEKYAIAFAGDIIASIAPGSIYFGGTDSGRFLVTALCASHVNADPFFVLTQNALVDSRSYLRYVRGMYSDRIFIPSDRDVADAFKQYQEDARQRHSDGKLSPGERFEDVASVDQLTHQVSIWAINGLLTRLVFDRNTDREFYVEESFPLEWMYPRLTPNGLIMKINRQPLSELDAEIVRRDREFWIGYLAPIVGAWLNHQSNLAEIVEFIERVYLRDELRGFSGDPHYVHNEIPQQSFSKLRSTFGGLYAWRAGNCRSGDEKEFLLKEAEFAFRQALVLCPKSPEVVFRYVNLLLGQKRVSDAIRIVEPAVKLANVHQSEAGTMVRPTQLETLLRQLNKMNRN